MKTIMLVKRFSIIQILLLQCLIVNVAPQSVPDKIVSFFQTKVIKPLQETVKHSVKEISAIFSSNSKQTPNTTVGFDHTEDSKIGTSANSTNISNSSMKISPGNKNESVSTSENPNNGSASIKIMQDTNTTNPEALSPENIEKLKSLCAPVLRHNMGKVLQYRYDENTGRCYEMHRRGPCGDGMSFYPQGPKSILGRCDCKVGERFYVYHEQSKSCYKIFTQGYCQQGYWVDLTKSGVGTCSLNPCNEPGFTTNTVYMRGKCVELYQKNSEVCDENQIVDFVHLKRLPQCVDASTPIKVITGGNIYQCPPGTYIAKHGGCHQADWDFGDEEEDSD